MIFYADFFIWITLQIRERDMFELSEIYERKLASARVFQLKYYYANWKYVQQLVFLIALDFGFCCSRGNGYGWVKARQGKG